mgnify:CR=1 FL=1
MTATVVIGLGNPILGDDGVGWRVAELVKEKLQTENRGAAGLPAGPHPVSIECYALGGLSLMENLVGYEQAIIIDAIHLGNCPQGTVSVMTLDELPNRAAGHLASAHDTTLHNALRMGREMGAKLPESITIVAIESDQVYDFSEELSPAVQAAIPLACQRVLDTLNKITLQEEVP